jgi:protein phosphatase 2C-like protein
VSRQDAVEARAHPRTGAVVFAVADGVASAPFADVGAHLACELAVMWLLEELDRDPDGPDCAEILDEVAAAMCERLGGHPSELAATFGTTLVAGAVMPGPDRPYATVVQVGDSAAWLLRHGRFAPLVATKAARLSTVVISSVPALPDRSDWAGPVGFDLPPDGVLLVGTDGFGDPLGDGTGLVGQLFADVLDEVPPPLALAHALDFSRETFDDDRTLVAIWPGDWTS